MPEVQQPTRSVLLPPAQHLITVTGNNAALYGFTNGISNGYTFTNSNNNGKPASLCFRAKQQYLTASGGNFNIHGALTAGGEQQLR